MNVCMCICECVRIEEFAHVHKCAREVLCRCFYTYENIHVHVCSHVTVYKHVHVHVVLICVLVYERQGAVRCELAGYRQSCAEPDTAVCG